jgi:hypothetical protein
MTNAAATIAQAHAAAAAVTHFFCASVGRALNTNEEFSILVEWHDAIEAATAAALSIRSWVDVADMDKMADECAMWLDHWKEAA